MCKYDSVEKIIYVVLLLNQQGEDHSKRFKNYTVCIRLPENIIKHYIIVQYIICYFPKMEITLVAKNIQLYSNIEVSDNGKTFKKKDAK